MNVDFSEKKFVFQVTLDRREVTTWDQQMDQWTDGPESPTDIFSPSPSPIYCFSRNKMG